MKDQISKVESFNKAFRAGYKEKPCLIMDEQFVLRYNLMVEENEEYLTACNKRDLVEIADALGDKLYILLGTIINHGMQGIIEEVFDSIHQNNMEKLDSQGNPIINGENGIFDSSRPIGKVLKPKNWKPVDLKQIVERI